MGGAIAAIEKGYFQREIHEVSYHHQKEVEAGRRTVVGVNRFSDTVEPSYGQGATQTFQVDQNAVRKEQMDRLGHLKESRDNASVKDALDTLLMAAEDPRENLVPPILKAVKRYCTLGEICDVLRKVWGDYKEAPFGW